MYHPAKVEEIVDGEPVVLVVSTWDDNTFTLDVADGLSVDAVEEGSIVLLDYYPDERFDMPTAKMVVSKLLDGEQGERVWERYREQFEETQQQQTAMLQQHQPFEGGYIG